MDGYIFTPHSHIVLFICPFVLDFRSLTRGRHLHYSLMRSIKFPCLVFVKTMIIHLKSDTNMNVSIAVRFTLNHITTYIA